MVTPIKSSLDCVQIAWAKLLRDFRVWTKPEGQALYRWKTAPLKHAIMACRSNMIDDAEAMIKAWETTQSEPGQAQSAFIPVMTTAIAPIQAPPDFEQVVGRSEWLEVVVPSDPLGRVVRMRTMPAAFRCQIAFFCPDNSGAMMLSNQFCLYMRNEAKRTFAVNFELGKHGEQVISDDWRFRVLENTLMPDVALQDYKNLTVVTVDCTIVGSIPIVTGLGGEWDDLTDTHEYGTPPGYPPIVGGRDEYPDSALNLVVTDADVYDKADARHVHLHADVETGEITQTELGD